MASYSGSGGFLGFDAPYEAAELVLFGAPFDGTTSFRPGTRFGPDAARREFYGLETYSPYLKDDLETRKLFDGGDLELPFGNTEKALDQIYEYARQILSDGKKPFMVGGEHLVTLPVIRALQSVHSDLCILHLDAHADLRMDYLGETLSHATVMRRCWELLGDQRIFQFGIRSGSREELEWASDHVYTEFFEVSSFKEVVARLAGRPIYVSIDLDVLDPSVFPGTGTLEPGGILFKELMACIACLRGSRVVGADVVELSPHYDPTGASTAVACKTIRELVLAITQRGHGR